MAEDKQGHKVTINIYNIYKTYVMFTDCSYVRSWKEPCKQKGEVNLITAETTMGVKVVRWWPLAV